MDVVEAFEALGLEEPKELSAEQLKRSYLRKVKQHPPERDPDGFQRVRQAYELLQGHTGSFTQPAAPRATEPGPNSTPSAPSAAERPSTAPADIASPDAAHIEPAPPATPATTSPSRVDALSRLREAFRQSKWVTAANTLLEIYAEPSQHAELPPPAIALRVCLELFESGKQKTARRLVESFRSHIASYGAHLSPETASIWKLLSELSELSRAVDEPLTSALAEAIRSGGFQEVLPELRAEIDQYGEGRVTGLMQSRAPTLFAATWPYAKPRTKTKKNRAGTTLIARLSVFGIFLLYKMIGALSGSSGSVEPKFTAHAALSAPHSTLDADDTSKLQGMTRDLEALYSAGNCSAAQAAWGDYLQFVHTFRTTEAVRQGYLFRRKQMVDACPASAPELPEEP